MPPQRATLNFVNGGAYMALSLPVSAFPYATETADLAKAAADLSPKSAPGPVLHMTQEAYQKYLPRLTADVQAHVQLRDAQGPLPLEGTLLNFTPPDDDPGGAASQLVVLGRFNLRHPDDAGSAALRWRIELYGRSPDEQRITATATRVHPETKQKQQQLLVFGPEEPERQLFPSASAVLVDYAKLGMDHILSGMDHLLFLLAVLASLSGWRLIVLTLTSFTAGHAVTLSLSLLGGVQLPATLVEPGIALTIVGVAGYDLWASYKGRHVSTRTRLALVFACALIHGLGLASALESRGLDREHLWQSLLGFNAGIELGQMVVGGVFVAFWWALRHGPGPQAETRSRQVAAALALGAGMLWFLQRTLT